MSSLKKASILATGFSMFSMFFGAGNVVFPLVLGQTAGSHVVFASIGLMITAILLPFIGLFSMMLYQGDYKSYFLRLGKGPGLFLIFLIMAILGPFAGMPRTITLSHSTLVLSGVDISAWLFDGIFCVLIFVMAYKRTAIVDILGYFLTPLLVILLALITIAGIFMTPEVPPVLENMSTSQTFLAGILEGYNTLDLLAALFFSTVIIAALQERFKDESAVTQKQHIFHHAGWASVIGAVLLGVVYLGFCLLAAKYSGVLVNLDSDELIAYLSYQILGNYGGWAVNGVVSLACLTTAIALASVFAETMCKEITRNDDHYPLFLFGTVLAAYGMSFIGFTSIVALIAPLLLIAYPAVIVLAIMNIGHKLWGWKIVKTPFYVTIAISLVLFFM